MKQIDAILLAEVALEVAVHRPDDAKIPTRAQWRWATLDLAELIIADEKITKDSEDLDEIVMGWFAKEDALS